MPQPPESCSALRLATRRIALVMLATTLALPAPASAEISARRMTAVVRAVQSARGAVVNIQGQKTVTEPATTRGAADTSRQVNGMGTGVIIDPRGYILTNHHVVDGVKQINVKLDDGSVLVAFLVAHDRGTDLAIIKIRANRSLPTINLGTSSDLLTGEPVIAMGNAYGYEHTVTRGIISALHRDVQVSETQAYEDLIQTDASINPGNSGGPLLNADGAMVGVNVAVRAGAQGIGFAIPIDKAIAIAAELMSVERLENKQHGIAASERLGDGRLVVRRVEGGSAADRAGLRAGDIVTDIAGVAVERPLDIELALLGRRVGQAVPVHIERNGESAELSLAVANRRSGAPVAVARPEATVVSVERDDETWRTFGLSLREESRSALGAQRSRYRGGMRVVEVRPGSPAATEGIQPGDVLVGMALAGKQPWETVSTQDMRYIVTRAGSESPNGVKFYIVRGDETLYGKLQVATAPRSVR